MQRHLRLLFCLCFGLLLVLAGLGRSDDAPPTKADLQKALDNYIAKKPPEWKPLEGQIDDKVVILDFIPAPNGAHTVKVAFTPKDNRPLTDLEKVALDLRLTVLVKNALTGQGGVFDKEQGMVFKQQGNVIAVSTRKEAPPPEVGNAERERQLAEEERKRNELERQKAEAERLRNERERQRQIKQLQDLLRRIQAEQRNRATRQSTEGYYSLVVAPSRIPTPCGPYGSFVYVWVPLERDTEPAPRRRGTCPTIATPRTRLNRASASPPIASSWLRSPWMASRRRRRRTISRRLRQVQGRELSRGAGGV